MITAILDLFRRIGIAPQFGGFLLSGALNTVITILVYEGLILVLHYAWAYAISFLTGFIYSTAVNGKYVFRTGISLGKAAAYFLVFLANMLVGLWVMRVLIGSFGVNQALAPFLAIAITLPLNFLLSRYVFTGHLTGRD